MEKKKENEKRIKKNEDVQVQVTERISGQREKITKTRKKRKSHQVKKGNLSKGYSIKNNNMKARKETESLAKRKDDKNFEADNNC